MDPDDSKPSPQPPSFQIGAISAGDVVFVYDGSTRIDKKVKRFLNVIGQRILASIRRAERVSLRPRVRKYSHVMLGVGGGLIIHADGKTVAVEVVSDALHHNTKDAALFKVYRRKDMSQGMADKIVKSAMRYYGKKYSFTKYFAESDEEDTTQFCSRLVAHAYRAAGTPLGSLDDNRVLPLDLYQACQTDGWEDISAEFLQAAPSAEADKLLPPIEIPGEGALPLSELAKRSDELQRKMAESGKQTIALQYETTRMLLENEATLAKYVGAQFDLTKKLRMAPSALADEDAFRVTRVLEQLNDLLALSKMPSIELLVPETYVNTVDKTTNKGLYAGYPAPVAIREMQLIREAIRIYDYLLLAEIGLFTILAHRTPNETFEPFRAVKAEYAARFEAALKPFDDFASYENGEELFDWVERESDRATCRQIVGGILPSLKVVAILRGWGTKGI
jgi:Permuted papain-like amidase enzyme, YaeF/YiiX, C92 family